MLRGQSEAGREGWGGGQTCSLVLLGPPVPGPSPTCFIFISKNQEPVSLVICGRAVTLETGPTWVMAEIVICSPPPFFPSKLAAATGKAGGMSLLHRGCRAASVSRPWPSLPSPVEEQGFCWERKSQQPATPHPCPGPGAGSRASSGFYGKDLALASGLAL